MKYYPAWPQNMLKTGNLSVLNNKLAMFLNNFFETKFYVVFCFVQKEFCDNFYAVLIFYCYVGHHPMGLDDPVKADR